VFTFFISNFLGPDLLNTESYWWTRFILGGITELTIDLLKLVDTRCETFDFTHNCSFKSARWAGKSPGEYL